MIGLRLIILAQCANLSIYSSCCILLNASSFFRVPLSFSWFLSSVHYASFCSNASPHLAGAAFSSTIFTRPCNSARRICISNTLAFSLATGSPNVLQCRNEGRAFHFGTCKRISFSHVLQFGNIVRNRLFGDCRAG